MCNASLNLSTQEARAGIRRKCEHSKANCRIKLSKESKINLSHLEED